jgi:hypothetical protein
MKKSLYIDVKYYTYNVNVLRDSRDFLLNEGFM